MGRELIWAVGFTSGGAPFGLRISDFEPADLEAMGLDFAALCDAGRLMTAESVIDPKQTTGFGTTIRSE